jgi:hypothetical protein
MLPPDFQLSPRISKARRAVTIGMPRNDCKTSRSLSPLTIKSTGTVTAHARTCKHETFDGMAAGTQSLGKLGSMQGLVEFDEQLIGGVKATATRQTRIKQTGGKTIPQKAGDERVGISDDLHRYGDFS